MTDSPPADSERRRKIFVVHGRNEAVRVAMFTFLRSIGLIPIEWSQAIAMTRDATPYIGEVLDVALEAAQAVVVLLSPDEIASLRAEYADGDDDPEARPSAQARPNVLFEAGLALGRAAQRTVLVEFGKVRHFSDIAGRHVVRVSDSVASRQHIASRLQAVGCAVDLSGTDWHVAGDFTTPPPLVLTSAARWPSSAQEPGEARGKCRGWIDSPNDCDTVGRRIAVRGGARDVPPRHSLWIGHRVNPGGLFWPKDAEITLDQKGHFDVYVYEVGSSPRIYVTLLLVTAAVSADFDRWINKGSQTGHYPGLRPLPDSYVELASVCLLYDPSKDK